MFVIGGAMFYRTMVPYCSEILVTKVDADGEAQVFFENLDDHPDFLLVYEGEPMEENGITFRFTTYRNQNVKEF